MLWNEPCATIADSRDRFAHERFHFHEPLFHQVRFDIAFGSITNSDSVLVIFDSDKQTFRDPENKRIKHPATEWLLDVMAQTPAAYSNQVFRIHNKELLDLLKLDKKRRFFRYSLSEFADDIGKVDEEANRARAVDPKARDVFDNQVLGLAEKPQVLIHLPDGFHHLGLDDRLGGEFLFDFFSSLI